MPNSVIMGFYGLKTARRLARACLIAWALFSSAAPAQELIPAAGPDGGAGLLTSDAAILETRSARKDFPCSVSPIKPNLGFDLRFHSGYAATVPPKGLAGAGNQLTMVFKVTPQEHPDEPVYLSQRVNIPAFGGSGGPASLEGGFDLGEGKYHVNWLMRDRNERVCSGSWDVDASLPAKDRQMALAIAPAAVRPPDTKPFQEEPRVEGAPPDGSLHVKVVVNFAPQDAGSAALQPPDITGLMAILRNMARDSRITRFSLVAYNMEEQRVIYRQEAASRIDFPALGEALNSLKPGTVDIERLARKHGDADFLASLITQEVAGGKDRPDAVIFAGPKVVLDDGIPPEMFAQLADLNEPVFYMNYDLYPQVYPWRDAIGNAVKSLKGTEYTISRPRDLYFSWADIMARIVKSKLERTAASNASSQ